jgi:hypothetical protein
MSTYLIFKKYYHCYVHVINRLLSALVSSLPSRLIFLDVALRTCMLLLVEWVGCIDIESPK